MSYNDYYISDDYKTVGRFTLKGFEPIGDDLAAIIDFNTEDCDEDSAFSKIGVTGDSLELKDCHLALLIDTTENEQEKEYLKNVLDAQWALSNIQCAFNDVFQAASNGEWPVKDIDLSRKRHWGAFQKALKGLLKDERAQLIAPTLDI